MTLRKWAVRGLVFSLAGAIGTIVVLYEQLTNPQVVRQQVVERLSTLFTGAHVSLDAAHMRLFGGIVLNELRLTRRDDPGRVDLLYVPSATIQIDKERLNDGKLALRKLEFHKPRLRIIRNADGKWNLSGLLAPTPSDPSERLPTIVLEQAVVQIKDHLTMHDSPPLEIKDINLSIINDPLPLMVIDGVGAAEGIGQVHVRGSIERETGKASLSLSVSQIRVGSLIESLSHIDPEIVKHVLQLDGVGTIDGQVAFDPAQQDPLHWDLRMGLAQGHFAHARLPITLDDVEAAIHLVNHAIATGRATARSGKAQLSASVEGFDLDRLLHPDEDHPYKLEKLVAKLDVNLQHLPVAGDFFDLLPETYKQIETDYQPRGPASLRYLFTRDDPQVGTRYCKVVPEGARALVDDFPYKYAENVTGVVEFNSGKGQQDHLSINLSGTASNQPVTVTGEILGETPNHEVKLEVKGRNIPLDDTLKQALPRRYRPIAESFHPRGQGDFVATIYRSPKTHAFANRYLVKFHHTQVWYDVFPYPLEEVSGILDICPDKHFEFRDFHGRHKGGEFHIAGRSFRDGDSQGSNADRVDRIEMTLSGKGFLLDKELRQAVARSVDDPGMPRAWDAFDPRGRINFHGTVVIPAGKKNEMRPEIELTILPQGCRIRPTFFPYEMTDLYGSLHYAQGKIDVKDARACHGKSVLKLDHGEVLLKPGGGVYAVMDKIEGDPLIPDKALTDAMPTVLKKGCETLQITDPLTFRTKMIADTTADPSQKPTIYWDAHVGGRDITVHTGITLEHVTGEVACVGCYDPARLEEVDRGLLEKKPKGKPKRFLQGNVKLDSVTLFKKERFTNVQISDFYMIETERDVLRAPEILAEYCGGKAYGPLRIEWGPSVRFFLDWTATDVDVSQFARMNFDQPDEVSGKATVRLALQGKGSDPANVVGKGIIEIPNGKLYKLPPLVSLLKFLGLRLPDRTAFEEAYAAFDIDRGRVAFTQIKVLGDAFSLQGKGSAKLDGTDLNMEFNVGWARIARVLPVFVTMERTVSEMLFKLKVTGEIGNVTYTKETVPVILDPVKKLINPDK